MTFHLGLTGSIGMGKSTTARFFVEEGCALWDADASVHRLYALGGAAVEPISNAFPQAIVEGAVDRAKLKDLLSQQPEALKTIETIVHPLVALDREQFKKNATSDILVFDIPLLFETGGNHAMNAVVCVTVDAETQEKRVLERGTMTRDQLKLILEKQIPNTEKVKQSDFVIVTDTMKHAQQQVEEIVRQIKNGWSRA